MVELTGKAGMGKILQLKAPKSLEVSIVQIIFKKSRRSC